MTVHYAVAGDTATILETQLDGVDTLTGCAVRCHIRSLLDATVHFDLGASVMSATDRTVRCVMSDPAVPPPGDYELEWFVTFPDGIAALSWPTMGTDYLRCREGVA